jgi:hypothetical protein
VPASFVAWVAVLKAGGKAHIGLYLLFREYRQDRYADCDRFKRAGLPALVVECAWPLRLSESAQSEGSKSRLRSGTAEFLRVAELAKVQTVPAAG